MTRPAHISLRLAKRVIPAARSGLGGCGRNGSRNGIQRHHLRWVSRYQPVRLVITPTPITTGTTPRPILCQRTFLKPKLSPSSSPSPSPARGSRRQLSHKSTTNDDETPNQERTAKPRRWLIPTLFLAGLLSALPVWLTYHAVADALERGDILLEWSVGRALNERTFVPFSIVSREQVSPTGFIITVQPRHARDRPVLNVDGAPRFLRELHSSRAVLEMAWRHGLWCVEIKQPQLQVAREYTPLPYGHGHGNGLGGKEGKGVEFEDDLAHGRLRFLIRKMDGGEVSTYLSGLAVGDTVELRGPHLGFDVRGRLGTADRVVFLAGGTGIAPALQVVRALLGGDDRGQRGGVDGGVRKQALPSVSILWANRKRTDCAGCEQDEGGNDGDKSAIVSLLAEAKQRHGDRLKYACTVDEEGSFIGVGAITDATGLSPSLAAGSGSKPSSSWSSWFSWGMRKNSDTKAGSSAAAAVPITTRSIISSDGCVYHSAARLVFMAGHDSTDGGERKCECVDVHGKRAAAGGKNLLMVSGPEGFISAYAGAKILGAGGEVQGPLGGLVGNLKRRYPEFWADWMILKL